MASSPSMLKYKDHTQDFLHEYRLISIKKEIAYLEGIIKVLGCDLEYLESNIEHIKNTEKYFSDDFALLKREEFLMIVRHNADRVEHSARVCNVALNTLKILLESNKDSDNILELRSGIKLEKQDHELMTRYSLSQYNEFSKALRDLWNCSNIQQSLNPDYLNPYL